MSDINNKKINFNDTFTVDEISEINSILKNFSLTLNEKIKISQDNYDKSVVDLNKENDLLKERIKDLIENKYEVIQITRPSYSNYSYESEILYFNKESEIEYNNALLVVKNVFLHYHKVKDEINKLSKLKQKFLFFILNKFNINL